MSNENIFKEIEEDLERQKYEALWKRYGGFVVVFALAVVAGTASYNLWQTRMADMRQKSTGELADILDQNKNNPARQIDALEDFAQTNPKQTQAVLAELQAAAEAAKQGNTDQSVKIYDAVAGDDKADCAFRQLADLHAVALQLDKGDPATLQKRLQPLMANNAPWRASAMEYSGFLAYRAGDTAKARGLFTALSQDASVPQTISARATDMLRIVAE